MLTVPRAVRFATWATAVLHGVARPDGLVRAVADPDDVALRVEAGAEAEPGDLTGVLALAAGRGATGFRAVLPVPGDVTGLPGPAGFNALACEVGQAVLTTGTTAAMGVLPHTEVIGSHLEPGTVVTWRVQDVQARPHLDVADLAEADRALRTGLVEATRVLRGLDVARWRPEVAELWADLADLPLDSGALPPRWPPRAVAVLASGLRLRAVVALALDDDGGAVSGWEAQQRRATLRELDGVARRAVAAAAGPHPEGLRAQRATER